MPKDKFAANRRAPHTTSRAAEQRSRTVLSLAISALVQVNNAHARNALPLRVAPVKADMPNMLERN